MAVSKRKRDCLGICALRTDVLSDTPISWDKYKELTGVDLESVFEIVLVGTTYYVGFKGNLSKLILLDLRNVNGLQIVEGVFAYQTLSPIVDVLVTWGATLAGANVQLFFTPITNAPYSVMVTGDKKIGLYVE